MHLLIIDCQNDFCRPSGTMYIPGSEMDTSRIANFIYKFGSNISDITVTLDSHPFFHIGHPCFWTNKHGLKPKPFTRITIDEIRCKDWFPVNNKHERALHYAEVVWRERGLPVEIWNPHCITGTKGQNIVQEIALQLEDWSKNYSKPVHYIAKGSNPYMDQYSAAGVDLFARLESVDKIVVCGEALSHCVRFTIEDVLSDLFNKAHGPKAILLRDATSIIKGYEQATEEFLIDVQKRGCKITTTENLMKGKP